MVHRVYESVLLLAPWHKLNKLQLCASHTSLQSVRESKPVIDKYVVIHIKCQLCFSYKSTLI